MHSEMGCRFLYFYSLIRRKNDRLAPLLVKIKGLICGLKSPLAEDRGIPWWLRWLRICSQCKRSGFDPWVGKIPWRANRSCILAWRIPSTEEPAAAAAAKSLQLCPTLCDPINGSPPGSPIPGILQARTLELFAISFSNAWKWKVKVKLLSHVRLVATPWTTAHQAPPSMRFSRQEYWSGVPSPSPS